MRERKREARLRTLGRVISIACSLLAALSYGTGDFFGGIAARRAAALAVTFIANVSSVLPLMLLVLLRPGQATFSDMLFGVLAGGCAGTALVLLYGALARGTMGIVSPISAVVAALVPLVVGLALGEHLRTLQAIGIVAALIAIALISADGGVDARAATRTEVRSAVLCGVFFGLVYVFLGFARSQAGLWPLAAERGGAVIALGLVGVLTRAPLVFGGRSLWVSCLAGFFDLGAQALYLIARQAGTLSIAAVLTSLYPVSTFFLARVVLGERLRRLQIIGVLIALGAIALIVA